MLGYAEDKYPHFQECDACFTALADQVKSIDIKEWLETHPEQKAALQHLLD